MSVGDLTTWITDLFAWVPDIPSMINFAILYFIVVGLLAARVGLQLVREFLTYRWLAPHRRRRYLVRPVGDAKWAMADILMWAGQLTMIRRRYRTTLDRPAHALRFRLQATPDGPRYMIEGSSRIERIMRNPALPNIEVIRLHPSQDDGAGGGTPAPPGSPRTPAPRGARP